MLAFLALTFGTIAKAMLTGVGLAAGFAIVNGVPKLIEKLIDARVEGTSIWRACSPGWLTQAYDGITGIAPITESL